MGCGDLLVLVGESSEFRGGVSTLEFGVTDPPPPPNYGFTFCLLCD